MIYIIGLGVEGKNSLSSKALSLIENANVLVGGKRHLASFPKFQGKKVIIGSNLDEVIRAITPNSELRTPNSIVVLASGDPNFFGIADFLIKRFGKDAVEIIPNVSAMQYAFARIKENWNDARFLSLHGRGQGARDKAQGNTIDNIVDDIVCYDKVGIFTDPDNTPARIAKAMMDKGVKDYRAYVCEDLGTDKEKITGGALAQIAKKKFSSLNVMVLIKEDVGSGKWEVEKPKLLTHFVSHTPHPTPHIPFGIPDSAFSHSAGMITKEEIRVISLSKLKLKPDSIVWDIGAGSGSLSIEAAMLADKGKVFAIEKQVERIRHIEKNKKKFKVANLEIIHKNAPDSLKTLPVPDAVFVGGGGKGIGKILDVCASELKQGGRVVVNAITLETLSAAAVFFENAGWDAETISVNIAKTRDVAGLHIFNAHNPVFIIVGEKP